MPIPLIVPLLMAIAGKGMMSAKTAENQRAMDQYGREMELEEERDKKRQERADRLSNVLRIMGSNVQVPKHEVGGKPKRPFMQDTGAEEGLIGAAQLLGALSGNQAVQGSAGAKIAAAPGSYQNPLAGGPGVKAPGLWTKMNPDEDTSDLESLLNGIPKRERMNWSEIG